MYPADVMVPYIDPVQGDSQVNAGTFTGVTLAPYQWEAPPNNVGDWQWRMAMAVYLLQAFQAKFRVGTKSQVPGSLYNVQAARADFTKGMWAVMQ